MYVFIFIYIFKLVGKMYGQYRIKLIKLPKTANNCVSKILLMRISKFAL